MHQSTSLCAHSSHYSLLFSFRTAIHDFLVLKLAFSWTSIASISPPLLGSSSPSTSSVGTDAYRQKAILPTSYQASPEIYEGADCKDDSHRCSQVRTILLSLTPRSLSRFEGHTVTGTAAIPRASNRHAHTSFGRLCMAGDDGGHVETTTRCREVERRN